MSFPRSWFWELLVWSVVIWGRSGVILECRITVCYKTISQTHLVFCASLALTCLGPNCILGNPIIIPGKSKKCQSPTSRSAAQCWMSCRCQIATGEAAWVPTQNSGSHNSVKGINPVTHPFSPTKFCKQGRYGNCSSKSTSNRSRILNFVLKMSRFAYFTGKVSLYLRSMQ